MFYGFRKDLTLIHSKSKQVIPKHCSYIYIDNPEETSEGSPVAHVALNRQDLDCLQCRVVSSAEVHPCNEVSTFRSCGIKWMVLWVDKQGASQHPIQHICVPDMLSYSNWLAASDNGLQNHD